MEIIVGKYAGFCNGANNAVTKTLEALNGDKVYSIGDIIHNEIVVNDLKNMGLIIKNNMNEIPDNSRIIIRAHGESIEFYQEAKNKNLDIVDLTCPKVKLVHDRILENDNSFIIIIGKKTHPEVIAHKSYSKTCYVVENYNDIVDAYNSYLLSNKDSLYIVAQTTFNSKLFDEIVNKLKEVFKCNIIIDKTICNATSIRQKEAGEIASKVDKMIVIGGKNSSNTKELEVVAKEYCNEVYLIQSKDDLDKDMFNSNDIIGITAGASTPSILIDEVVEFLSKHNRK